MRLHCLCICKFTVPLSSWVVEGVTLLQKLHEFVPTFLSSFRVYTAMKIPFMCFQKRNCAASVPFSIVMCMCAVHVYVTIFSCSRIGRPVVEICKSLLDTSMWKSGLRSRKSFSGNIYFEFLLLCLCSVGHFLLSPWPTLAARNSIAGGLAKGQMSRYGPKDR